MVNHSKAIVRLPHLLWAPPLCFFSRLDAAETRCHRQQTHIAEPFVHSHKPTPCLTCQHLSVPGALFSGEPYGGPRAVLWRCLTGCRCIVALIWIHCGNITIPPLRARRRMTRCHCYQSSTPSALCSFSRRTRNPLCWSSRFLLPRSFFTDMHAGLIATSRELQLTLLLTRFSLIFIVEDRLEMTPETERWHLVVKGSTPDHHRKVCLLSVAKIAIQLSVSDKQHSITATCKSRAG